MTNLWNCFLEKFCNGESGTSPRNSSCCKRIEVLFTLILHVQCNTVIDSVKSKLGNIAVHKDKMADASAHDEQMKNFVRAEIFMKGIENRKLERINYAANCIDDAACKKPPESRVWQSAPQGAENQ